MRGSRIALIVAAAIVAVVVVAVVASSGSVDYAERWPTLPWEASGDGIGSETPAEPIELTPRERELELEDNTSEMGDAFGVILVGLAAVAVATMIGRHRHARVRWQAPRESGEFQIIRDRLDEVSTAVEDDAAEQRELLLAGEPRNAIVECWQRLETLLVEVGVERQPSDTSTDLVIRALGRTDVDGDALEAFADLYREARFSSHPMGEPERRAALVSLDALHAALRSRHSTGTISTT